MKTTNHSTTNGKPASTCFCLEPEAESTRLVNGLALDPHDTTQIILMHVTMDDGTTNAGTVMREKKLSSNCNLCYC
jgi:hypothetical protein